MKPLLWDNDANEVAIEELTNACDADIDWLTASTAISVANVESNEELNCSNESNLLSTDVLNVVFK